MNMQWLTRCSLALMLCALPGCQPANDADPEDGGEPPPPTGERPRPPVDLFERAVERGEIFDAPVYKAEYHPELNHSIPNLPEGVVTREARFELAKKETRQVQVAALNKAKRSASFMARVKVKKLELMNEKLVLDPGVGAENVSVGYATAELIEPVSGSPPASFRFRFFPVSSGPALTDEAFVVIEQGDGLLHMTVGMDIVEGRVWLGLEPTDFAVLQGALE